MSNLLFVVFVFSAAIGLKNKLYGAILGCFLTAILYLLFFKFEFIMFGLSLVLGSVISFINAYFTSWLFSGFRGGRHNSGPAYWGGGAGQGWGEHSGGIVYTDEEVANIKGNLRANHNNRLYSDASR